MATVLVVGAGPAGLFAAQKIARAGHAVVILNRDIKPGGLAEYGIYPMKEKMKSGLRKQFSKILSLPNIAYFGHVPVGSHHAISIDDLRGLTPSAVVFSVGAQGTKELGLPGEHSKRVYSAKDFVYHYNLLPPFASQDFSAGKRVSIIGMGNVMVDIARWLLIDDPDRTAEEVTVIARRGPFEAKFDRREFDYIEPFLDRRALLDEMARVKDRIAAVGQDVSKVADTTFPVLAKPAQEHKGPRLLFRFLTSPQEIHADSSGTITRLTVSENLLVPRNGGTKAKATDQAGDLDFDTMIFAIGDVADSRLGLPFAQGGYVTHPEGKDTERQAYEVFDPQAGRVVEGVYVVGWARKASEGVVGKARYDAEQGATHIVKCLESASGKTSASLEDIRSLLKRKGVQYVDKDDLTYLGRAEERQARERGLPSFKFASNETMLSVIEEEKKQGKAQHAVA